VYSLTHLSLSLSLSHSLTHSLTHSVTTAISIIDWLELLNVAPEYNILDNDRRRPVHYAAACVASGPLEYLIGRGVDIREPDQRGITPLMVAAMNGRAHNIPLLLGSSADDEEDDEAGASAAASIDASGDQDNASVAANDKPIHYPIINMVDQSKRTALNYASYYGHTETVKILLEKKADIELQNNNKQSPLSVAALRGNLDCIKVLVENKADIESRCKVRRTPLMYAVMNGHLPCTRYYYSLAVTLYERVITPSPPALAR
jgi:ankyrin repeat protein